MTVEMTKKYWEDHRDKACKGSGVGKALEAYVLNCPRSPDQIKKKEHFDKALSTIDALEEGLKKGKVKVTALKESPSRKATLEMIDEMEKKRKHYKTDIEKLAAEFDQKRDDVGNDPLYQGKIKTYVDRRQKLLDFVTEGHKETTTWVARIKSNATNIEKLSANLEIAVTKKKDMTMADTFLKGMETLSQQSNDLGDKIKDRYDQDAPFIKQERGNAADAKNMGVLPEDAKKHDHIFAKATSLAAENGDMLRESVELLKDIAATLTDGKQLVVNGGKTMDAAIGLSDGMVKRITELQSQIDTSKQKFSHSAEGLAALINDKKAMGEADLDIKKNGATVQFSNVENESKSLNLVVGQILKTVNEGQAKIPKEFLKNDTLKSDAAKIKTILAAVVTAKKETDKAAAQARKNYDTIMKMKPTADRLG